MTDWLVFYDTSKHDILPGENRLRWLRIADEPNVYINSNI